MVEFTQRDPISSVAESMFPSLPISGLPQQHLSDLDCSTISESPNYPSASSDSGDFRAHWCCTASSFLF